MISNNRDTIQVRIERELHKHLKHESIEKETTITSLATAMIRYCITNKINLQ